MFNSARLAFRKLSYGTIAIAIEPYSAVVCRLKIFISSQEITKIIAQESIGPFVLRPLQVRFDANIRVKTAMDKRWGTRGTANAANYMATPEMRSRSQGF